MLRQRREPISPSSIGPSANLVSQGLLQVFAHDRIKLHDAARAVGKGRLLLHGPETAKARREALRVVVQKSLIESWHPAELSLFLRLSGEVGRLDVLVEMATDELFHEMGVWPEVEAYLEHGAQDETVPLISGSRRSMHWHLPT